MRDPMAVMGRTTGVPSEQGDPLAARELRPAHLDGVRELVALRERVLALGPTAPRGGVTADDLRRVLATMFPPESLELATIDWGSPRATHDALERHEAVHEITDRADLRRRLHPADRLCFGLFHAALPAEPVVFTEVALTTGMPESIADILAPDRVPQAVDEATTAVFYSISAAQPGLRGIAFGTLLISRAIAAVRRDLPMVKDVVTLSPMPGLRRWLANESEAEEQEVPPEDEALRGASEAYVRQARRADGQPIDAVARFHLGNGAALDRIHLRADPSPRGMRQSFGAMASYRYERQDL